MSFDAGCFWGADRDTLKSSFLLIYEIGRNIWSDRSECTGTRIHFFVVFLRPNTSNMSKRNKERELSCHLVHVVSL